jgi:hypothetical protein
VLAFTYIDQLLAFAHPTEGPPPSLALQQKLNELHEAERHTKLFGGGGGGDGGDIKFAAQNADLRRALTPALGFEVSGMIILFYFIF